MGLVGVLWYLAPTFLHTIECNLYDQHVRLRGPRAPNPQVAVVAIDERQAPVSGMLGS